MQKLSFKHLPGYAKYLLENKLEQLVCKQLELSREVEIPLLKLLEQMPGEQLFELSKVSTAEILSYAIQNNLAEQIELSLKQWKENLLPVMMTREQVVVDDITLASLIRKRSMLHFLPEYTSDLSQTIALVNELDVYIQASEAATFETYVGIQQERLNKSYWALAESEDQYAKMIQEVEDYAIIRMSPEGIIENWNRGAEKIKGYKDEEIIGKSFRIFYTPEDLANGLPQKLIKLAAETGRASTEGWRVRKDGSKFWGSITITAIHNPQNGVTGFTKVTRDLTARKQAELELEAKSRQLVELNESLEQKNKELERSNKELTAFSYVASHDLQEPLRKIIMFSQLISEREAETLSARGQELFTKIHMGAAGMKRLIEDLLSYSRVQSYIESTKPVDLNIIVSELKSDYADTFHENKLTIHSEQLPSVKGVSFQLYQLFENLIGNAVKYAKADVPPHIDIKSELVSGNVVPHEGANPEIDYHKVTFADNGIGFEQQYASKIFEIFQRLHKKTEYTGTGIGLAICKKIVQNHKGFIEATGVPDYGATFTIYLPA